MLLATRINSQLIHRTLLEHEWHVFPYPKAISSHKAANGRLLLFVVHSNNLTHRKTYIFIQSYLYYLLITSTFMRSILKSALDFSNPAVISDMEWTLVINNLAASYGNKQSDPRKHTDLDFIITIVEPSN